MKRRQKRNNTRENYIDDCSGDKESNRGLWHFVKLLIEGKKPEEKRKEMRDVKKRKMDVN